MLLTDHIIRLFSSIELQRELAPICPGPVRLADAALCLYAPILWPCHADELVHIRIDPGEGRIHVILGISVSSAAAASGGLDLIFGSSSGAPTTSSSGGNTSSATGLPAADFPQIVGDIQSTLATLEFAFNRPSTRRIEATSVSLSSGVGLGSGQLTSNVSPAQARAFRALSGEETRWRATIQAALDRLRVQLGLCRLVNSATKHRAVWQPVRRQLPILLPPSVEQAQQTASGSSVGKQTPTGLPRSLVSPPYRALLERVQLGRAAVVFIKLLPNNEHYLVF
ncbi:unnamed protein product [Protopolystoma xenopodis]|uniref:Uncharacterized protein n=1 Tax=Protopolystoma xenopodis TaxID=117903 RepID=A0A448WKH2_9PLAT|nr:unnamed protein product [Protopolystoma xenopodis]